MRGSRVRRPAFFRAGRSSGLSFSKALAMPSEVAPDWPVSPLDPWIALETLVTRANPWGEGEGRFGEPISLAQAIDLIALADFVVCNDS